MRQLASVANAWLWRMCRSIEKAARVDCVTAPQQAFGNRTAGACRCEARGLSFFRKWPLRMHLSYHRGDCKRLPEEVLGHHIHATLPVVQTCLD